MRNPGCIEVIGNFATDCKRARFHTHALEHGSIEAGWALMLTSTSSRKSRPEGMAVGSHKQNLARSARRWPAFLYRRTSSTLFLPKSKDSYSTRADFPLWKYQILWKLITQPLKHSQFSDTSQTGPQGKKMPVLQNHTLNKCFETLLSVEHIAQFFSDLSLSAIHVITGKKSLKREKEGRDREINSCRQIPTLLQMPV